MAKYKERKDKFPRYFLILGVVLVVIAIATCIIGGKEQGFSYLKIGKILSGSIIVTILFTTVIEYICKKNVEQLRDKNTKEKQQCYKRYAFLIGFVVILSYGMIMGSVYGKLYVFWMFGGMILSIALNPYIGIALHFFVFLLSCIFQGFGLEYFSSYFILGAGLCLLAPFLHQISNLGYVMIIGLVGNGMAIILEKDFSLDRVVSLNSLYSEISIFLVILFSAWISWVYQGYFIHGNFRFVRTGIRSFFSREENEWEEGMLVRIGDLENSAEEKGDKREFLEELGNTNYPLIKQLKEMKPSVYRHSKQVAVLAEGAAEQIGTDKQLVYLGGLYHEIGKLYSGDYVEKSISIGRQYGFPKELMELITEHNVKYKIPASKESAVLMLADSVVFLLERMEEKGVRKDKNVQDMIESIFRIRYEKGELDQSGLTIRDFKVLERYCMDYGLMISGKEEENDVSF